MAEQKFDVVVYGATSFVGQIICRYMLDQYGADGEIRWGIAGRSSAKLDSLKQDLGAAAQSLPVITADAADESALRALCEQTRVVLTTVGPYAYYGEPLVKVCAETGTDYVDLTGEVQWIRAMLEKYETTAKQNGARIVHCCGFDSIPSDMGVFFVQEQARNKFGKPCQRVKLRVKGAKGGMSGGTIASLMNVASEAAKNRSLRRILADPYALCLEGPKNTASQPDVKSATYDKDFDVWLAPFVMAAINTRVVHRSNMLLGLGYGNGFQYDEAMMTGKGAKGWATAQGMTAGMGGFLVAVAIKPTRWLLEKFVLPAPGEGPTPEEQENGFFDLRLYGETEGGQIIRAKVTGDRDPGYGSTAKMISQAALCLAKDIPATEKSCGFWTPSTIFGHKLIKRLEASAGLTFEVL
ncbi:MAG: saccharopine dehydrogenase NADP-binding domain-containing protein [Ketobacteraceae bacterium]|nr:saccharopine dehydrogenase NADP-binding domain-containing protein [Ketobacteraceae bacterium]